jgi:putative hydrolase of the HAD superfamily
MFAPVKRTAGSRTMTVVSHATHHRERVAQLLEPLTLPLRGAVFDLGGVMTLPLFRRRPDAGERELGFLGWFLREATEVYGLPTSDHDLHLLETGRLTEAEFFVRLCDRHAAGGNPRIDPGDAREILFGRPMVASEVMVDAVRRVRGAGYRTALLTNNAREWEPTWRTLLPFDELFDVVLDSSVVGLRKPDPAIYHLACERLGLRPDECLFVDDLECNVVAARELGMEALLCSGPATAAEVVRLLLDSRGDVG